MADLVVRNARISPTPARGTGLHDVAVRDGTIASIRPAGAAAEPEGAARVLDAEGGLLSPPLIDPHVHLDSALTVGEPRYNQSGTLIEGILTWAERKQTLTHEDVKRRAREAITWEVAQGTGLIRSHVDVCDPQLVALQALLELREELRDLVELELIAFPQDGVYSFPNGPELMRRAMELGCDAVGGIPHYELTREDGVQEVQFIFDLAREFGAPIDLHCDETDDPQSRFLEHVAARALRDGMQGRVVAGHTTAFGSYDDAYAFKLLQILKRAGVTIVANPLINITLQGRFDSYPKRRGMTRVKELDAAGVNVACGHDCIMDPWYPLGRGSLLDAVFMLVLVGQMTGREELFRAYDMVTRNPIRSCGRDWSIDEGKPAHFVAFDCADEVEAIRLRPAARWVVRHGQVVAETTPARSRLTAPGRERPIDFRPPAWPAAPNPAPEAPSPTGKRRDEGGSRK
jgi:cytosine deaminase